MTEVTFHINLVPQTEIQENFSELKEAFLLFYFLLCHPHMAMNFDYCRENLIMLLSITMVDILFLDP